MIYKEIKDGVVTGFVTSNIKPDVGEYVYSESSAGERTAWIAGLPKAEKAVEAISLEQRVAELEAEIKNLKGEA